MTKRRNFSDKFKAAVALEALRGDKTVQEIAAKRQLHPTQVSTWKRKTIEGMHILPRHGLVMFGLAFTLGNTRASWIAVTWFSPD
jgi:transposase-like protein